MKKILISISLCIGLCFLSVHNASACTIINKGYNYCVKNGSYFLKIFGPLGTEIISITLKQDTKDYNTLISSSRAVKVSYSYKSTDFYGVKITTTSTNTKLDIENNYTIVVIEGTYEQPAHTMVTGEYYDKCKDDNLPARMNFKTYTKDSSSTTNTLKKEHYSSNQTMSFSMQVNLAQTGMKTIRNYLVSQCYMGFYLDYPSYTVHFNANGGSGVSDITTTCGSTVSLPSTSKSYYNFNGWYNGSSKVDSAYVCNSDVYLNASFSPVTYNITYDLDGGNASNPTTYNCEQSFYLNIPTKKKYEFIGWTGSNGTTPIKSLRISGDHGDKHYVANYIRVYTPPTLNAYDRYIFIGQFLSKDDLLQHVSSIDEDDDDISKDILIDSVTLNDETIENFQSIDTSKEADYQVTFKVTDKNNLTTKKTIHVYVVSDTTSQVKTSYRFINLTFINTISENSIWNDDINYQKIVDSLNLITPIKSYKL